MEHRKGSSRAVNAGRACLGVKDGEEGFPNIMGNFWGYISDIKGEQGEKRPEVAAR